MKNSQHLLILVLLLMPLGFTGSNISASELKQLGLKAPQAEKIDHQYTHHKITINDPWNWLRDPDYPKTNDKPVLDYLKAENRYFGHFKKSHQPLISSLFEEFKGREEDNSKSVPWVSNGFEYRWEYKSGDNYRTYYRRALESKTETVFIDQSALAKGNKYFVMRGWDISPDNRYLAYAVDTSGDERYEIIIKDLSSGKLLPNKIPNNNGTVAFSRDSKNIVYGLLEKDKWRTKSIMSQCIKCSNKTARSLLSEDDTAYFLRFRFTKDNEFLILSSGKSDATEAYALAGDLSGEKQLLASRDHGFSYSVSHAHGKFYILANDTHVNFRIATVNDHSPQFANWKTLIKGSDNNYLQDLSTFKEFLVIKRRLKGLEQIVVMDYQGLKHTIDFPEKLNSSNLSNNPEFNQSHIRINYQSMITPSTVFDYDISQKKLEVKKVKTIPSGYDKSLYETKRIMASARDGTLVPVSLVHLKNIKLDGSNPLHLYAYGAYGSGMPTQFSTKRLSLIDRGVIYAIAHVRGGDEMGYQWYLDGKLNKRKNTFNDFVDVANHLINSKYTAKGNISISGRSAGGELMGAATIQAPDLWSAVILGVPFVDVLNTMLDATLPLTPPEWFEWGNPITSKESFEYIRSYSPYDNIKSTNYPPMMVTGGLNDPRVTYWEPAKWTAKMRHHKTDDNLLIMRINMGAGHFANSGRYGRLKDYAEEFAFILLSHGITK
jgi:oligopeptidase B